MGHLSRKLQSLLGRSASWVSGGRKSSPGGDDDEAEAVLESKEGSSRRRQLTRRWSWGNGGGGAPKGYLPVRAGDSEELFYIRAEHLNHPLIAELLQKSAEEYGFGSRHYTGALRLPCDPAHLRHLLSRLRLPHSASISSTSNISCSFQHYQHQRHSDAALIQ